MKRILLLLMCFVLVIGVIGCSTSNELPEGFEDEEFYGYMLDIAKTIEHDLKNKTITYQMDGNDEFIKEIIDYNNTHNLNDKEQNFLFNTIELLKSVKSYIEVNRDTTKIIDTDTSYGKLLYNEIKIFINTLGVDVEI